MRSYRRGLVTAVLVVSELRLLGEGLARLLEDEPGMRVLGASTSAPEALASFAKDPPDIVLLDSVTENPGVVRRVLDAVPTSKVVVVGVSELEDDVIAWAEAGVAGYVGRDASLGELSEAVSCAARGEVPISPRMAATLLKRVAALATIQVLPTGDSRLTKRELEIVGLIDEGLSNKAIAQRLCIELPTVKNHVHNILEKLQVSRRAEAAALVKRQGLWDGARADRVSRGKTHGSPTSPLLRS